LEALKEVDTDSLRERSAVAKRLSEQEEQLQNLQEEISKARQRLSAMENALHANRPPRRSEWTPP
ncbi:MAG: hypothetical protein ACXWG0_06380, partial [Chthoniobacterales bacterium]